MPTPAVISEREEQEQPLIAGSDDFGQEAARSHFARSSHDESTTDRIVHEIESANGRRKPLKLGEKIWVTATISLISFLSFSSQFLILIPYWWDTPGVTLFDALLCLVPFNIGVACIFYNYLLVVFTNPGNVPTGWEPDWDSIHGVEVKASTGAPRYCKVCRSYKPPRAHHCRTCKRCVLRMDHHCPWVANCIGHHNYGHFMRFLYSVDVTMIMHGGLLALRVLDWWSPMILWREPSTFAMVMLILNLAQGLPVLLMVGAFSLYHTYALCTNTTTIESWEKDKVATLVRRGKIEEVKYPYDLGMKRNIQTVLGRRMLFWCLPGAKPMGTGLDYALGEGNVWAEQFFWPPRDPSAPGYRGGARKARGRANGANGAKPSGSRQGKKSRRFKLPEGGPFVYGSEMLNPALLPTSSSSSSNPAEFNPSSDDAGQWSNASPYHPSFSRAPDSDDGGDDNDTHSIRRRHQAIPHRASEESLSSAEEAGVVDAGCIPPGTIPGSGKRPGDVRRKARTSDSFPVNGNTADEDEPEEEHEAAEAAEHRRWGSGSGEVFPRLFAEEDDGDEGTSTEEDEEDDYRYEYEEDDYSDEEDTDDAYGSEGHDDYDEEASADMHPHRRGAGAGPSQTAQLRTRVRRGSEGYEVRPMMYDMAYAADMEEEEERLRRQIWSERIRLAREASAAGRSSRNEVEERSDSDQQIPHPLQGRGEEVSGLMLPSAVMAQRAQGVGQTTAAGVPQGSAEWMREMEMRDEGQDGDSDGNDEWGDKVGQQMPS